MDNLTHTLVGWALGQTGLKRKSRKGLAALIMGANAPDIDVFLGWVPWEPLATHRGITHSLIVGAWVMPLLTAGALWLLDRWQVRRGATFASGLEMHFGWLLALAFIGCLTHPLLDWQTVYAVQLFSPVDLRWYHNDALFIIDVWVILALGLGIWLSRRRERRSAQAWGTPARAAIAAVFAYTCLNGVLGALARDAAARQASSAAPSTIVASPPPALFWKRAVVWRQDHVIYRAQYDPAHSLFGLEHFEEPRGDGMTAPAVRRAMSATPEIRRFMRWSILPVARLERVGCQQWVSFNDARYVNGYAAAGFWVGTRLPPDPPLWC